MTDEAKVEAALEEDARAGREGPEAEPAEKVSGEVVEAEQKEPGKALARHEATVPQVAGDRLPMELTADQLVQRIEKLQEAAAKALQEDVDYGKIPGVDKASLFKPGAEKLCLLFMLDPETDVLEKRLDPDGHLEIVARTTMYHAPTGTRLGSGIGSCSTRESRYAYRQADRTCPACGQAAIIKGKAEYGGGWVCFKKKGGCGAKYGDNDEAITSQKVGRIDNPDLPDVYNTVLKIASKRSLVDAVLRTTGASAIYTQDVEDNPPPTAEEATAAAKPKPEAEKPETATSEQLEALQAALKALEPRPEWAEAQIVKQAAKIFTRPIKKLADLTPDEADKIMQAAQKELGS